MSRYGNWKHWSSDEIKIVGAVDKTIAFWDGKSTGTLDTIKKTRRAGKSVHIVRVDEEHVDLFDLVSDT